MNPGIHPSTGSAELLADLRPALARARAANQAASGGVPRPIPVLVPSAQLGDWLQARLARDLGLSMGFEFYQPAAYFSRHLSGGAAAAEFASACAAWTPDRLRWQLLPFVDRAAHRLGQDPAKPVSPRDRFAFARLLAEQFDRYSRFRPDWPDRWSLNQPAWDPGRQTLPELAAEDEAWQRELWHAVASQETMPAHPARLLRKFADGSGAPSGPPVFVVGSNFLDPLLLRTLQALAQQGQTVSLHVLLPSLGYLGDIARRRSLLARYAENPEAPDETGGHPLLVSLGQQAVGTFLLLDTVSPDYSVWPEVRPAAADGAAAGCPLLHRLQADIREQRPPSAPRQALDAADSRPRLQPDDRSLRVHCCHSPRRELEILRDELLRAFAELPGLKPDEVMVAVTDFDAYAPLAEGILRAGPQPLPVRLTAVPTREANPIAVGLLALLRLSLGRHCASELVELLNLAAVQHHLELAGEEEALAQLADAIRQSGLTHGIDAADRGAGGDTGTWRAALDRLLAGAWFGPEAAAKDAGGNLVHAVAADLHHRDEIPLCFVGWLARLACHLQTWRVPAPAADWAVRLQQAVDDLLASDEHDDHAAAMGRLLGELAAVRANTPLDAGAMLDWLEPQLENATSLRSSMGGEILLGRPDQLHGLPCRVLAILGLQDGAFPRVGRRPAWDLLNHRPERWDGDPRTQDRQWFLDALLTPSDRLILSAANRSLRTPHDGPLSSCVEELLRVASATVRPAEGLDLLEQQIVVQHRIQPFAADYFRENSLIPRSFDAGSARIACDLAEPRGEAPPPFSSPPGDDPALPTGDTLMLTVPQLTAFWKEPAKAWLRAIQVDLAGDAADDTALDDAPLNLDPLQAFQVRAEALAARILATGPIASARLMADRRLPPGALGALAWDQCDRAVELLARGLAPLVPRAVPLGIDLAITAQVCLTGEVRLMDAGGPNESLLVYRVGKYEGNPRYQLEAFVQMLAATWQLGHPVACTILGLEPPAPKVLPGLEPDVAADCLRTLVDGFRRGQRRPLCFAPASSAALAGALAKGETELSALDSAGASWGREPFQGQPGGEGTTPAALLAWRDSDPFATPYGEEWIRWAKTVAAPLQAWWSGQSPEPAEDPAPKTGAP